MYKDTGHTYLLNLSIRLAGDHAHTYMDIYFAHDREPAIPDLRYGTKDTHTDYRVEGKEITRTTYSGGNHTHHVNGGLNESKKVSSYTGGNKPFDNRQVYTVVQFITYIKKIKLKKKNIC